jgi:hypothetical protein
VKATHVKKQPTPFASLIGIWEHLPEKEVAALEKAIVRNRKRSASKVSRIAKQLK